MALHRLHDVTLGEDRGDRLTVEDDDRADAPLRHRDVASPSVASAGTVRRLRVTSLRTGGSDDSTSRRTRERGTCHWTLPSRRGDRREVRGPLAATWSSATASNVCAGAGTPARSRRRRTSTSSSGRDPALDRQPRVEPARRARLLRRLRLEHVLEGCRSRAHGHRSRNARSADRPRADGAHLHPQAPDWDVLPEDGIVRDPDASYVPRWS